MAAAAPPTPPFQVHYTMCQSSNQLIKKGKFTAFEPIELEPIVMLKLSNFYLYIYKTIHPFLYIFYTKTKQPALLVKVYTCGILSLDTAMDKRAEQKLIQYLTTGYFILGLFKSHISNYNIYTL